MRNVCETDIIYSLGNMLSGKMLFYFVAKKPRREPFIYTRNWFVWVFLQVAEEISAEKRSQSQVFQISPTCF